MGLAISESTPYSQNYKDEFYQQYTEIKFETPDNCIKSVRQALEPIGSKLGFHSDLRYKTHHAVQHMSEGPLRGGHSFKASRKVIALLKKFESSTIIERIIEKLEYLHSIQKGVINPFSINQIAKRINEDMAKLDIGQSLLIPTDIWRHAMVMSLTCTSIRDGKKGFSIINYNEGLGLEYHYQEKIPKKATMYQVAFKVDKVLEEKLYNFINNVLYGVWDQVKFYKKLSSLGDIAPQQNDERLWSYGQMGGSCTFSCINAYIKSQLPNEVFQKFQIFSKKECLLKIYRQIRRGCGKNSLKKLIALEIINELENNSIFFELYSKQVLLDIKKELQEMDGTLKQNSKPKISKNNLRVLADLDDTKTLKQVYYIIKNSPLNSESINILKKYLPLSYKLKTKSEYSEVIKMSLKFIKQFNEKALNSEQIYFVTGLFCVINNILKTNFSSLILENFFQKLPVENFEYKMLNICNILNLYEKYNTFSNFDEIIKLRLNEYQKV